MEVMSLLHPPDITIDTKTALLVGAVVFLFLSWLVRRQPNNIPPGPRGWPLLGYLPKLMLSANPAQILADEAQRYGEVLSVNLAGQLAVVLGSTRAIREAFSRSPHISARPVPHIYDALVPNGKGNKFTVTVAWAKMGLLPVIGLARVTCNVGFNSTRTSIGRYVCT